MKFNHFLNLQIVHPLFQRTGVGNVLDYKQNGVGTILGLRTPITEREWNKNKMIVKKERVRNNLAEGSRSRMELKDLTYSSSFLQIAYFGGVWVTKVQHCLNIHTTRLLGRFVPILNFNWTFSLSIVKQKQNNLQIL